MKWLLLYLCCLNIISVRAQKTNFDQTVAFIQQKIKCCSVPFAASNSRKVDSIFIDRKGNISLFYSDKKPSLSFNIFALYKDDEETNGIDTVMGGKFIQFYIDEEKIRMIRFATREDAVQVYDALLNLNTLCSKEEKMFSDLNFNQTVDVINIRLNKWSDEEGLKLNAVQNGDVIITDKRDQTFRFNFFDLSRHKEGIEVEVCDFKSHAPRAWIHFRNSSDNIAFIRLKCITPEAELDIMRGAFLHLKSLCRKN